MYHVTKHYPHSLGLSVAFRQPRAQSHCRFIHGYALAFTFEFSARDLDANGWVIDFGSLKPIKDWLVMMFDHKLLIADNDPEVSRLLKLDAMPDYAHTGIVNGRVSIADTMLVEAVGMEAFAKLAFDECKILLNRTGQTPRVTLTKVTVAEHEGNSASYSEPL